MRKKMIKKINKRVGGEGKGGGRERERGGGGRGGRGGGERRERGKGGGEGERRGGGRGTSTAWSMQAAKEEAADAYAAVADEGGPEWQRLKWDPGQLLGARMLEPTIIFCNAKGR